MTKLKFILTQVGIFTGVLSAAGAATYGICYANKKEAQEVSDPYANTPLRPAEILMSSLTSLEQFSVDASLDFMYQVNATKGKVKIDGIADITNLDDIQLSADLYAKYDASSISGSVGYFDQTVYVDYNDSHLKMTNSTLTDFINSLPSLGINVAIPEEISSLDINSMSAELSKMEPIETTSGYLFNYELSDLITISFKSDSEYQFTGLKTNSFFYKDLLVSLDCDILNKVEDPTKLVNPETTSENVKYQEFRPAFNLIEGLINTFSNNQNTLKINFGLDKTTNDVKSDVIDLEADLSYNLDTSKVSLIAKLLENSRTHNISLFLDENKLYLNQNDINKVCIENETVLEIFEYIISLISEEKINEVFDSLSNSLQGMDLTKIISNLENLNSWISHINVEDNYVEITFDLSVFDIDVPVFTIKLSSENKELKGIYINNLDIKGYTLNLSVELNEYNLVEPVFSEYENIGEAANLLPVIAEIANQKQFRLELDGSVKSSDTTINPISIDAGVQFDIENKYGYGELTIVDRDNYNHNVKIDYRTDDNILLSYNEKLKAKFEKQAVNDIYTTVEQIISEKDDHFIELFGDTMDSLNNTILMKAIKDKDYGVLFATKTFFNIKVTSKTIELDLSGELLGLDDFTMHITINYDYENLYSIQVDNLKYNDETISFTLSLKEFDETLESQRLDISDTYLDFSDLKVLLNLGVNTSKFDDYRFNGNVGISLSIIGIDMINLSIPVDIKIKNDKGNVSLNIDLTNIPIYDLLVKNVNANNDYRSTNSRTASIYYKDNYVYITRTDNVTDGWFWNKKTFDVTYNTKVELNYFFDNILYYLCDYVLGLDSWIMDQISSSTSNNGDYQIPYEEVLNDFQYNSVDSYFLLDINLAKIANNDDLEKCTVKVLFDKEKELLTTLELYLGVSVGVGITLTASLDFVDIGQEVDLTTMNSYINSHLSDELNKEYVTESK